MARNILGDTESANLSMNYFSITRVRPENPFVSAEPTTLHD